MWYPAIVTTPASGDPVTLAEAKAQCRVTSSSEDAFFQSLIKAVVEDVEDQCGTPLVQRTVEVKCDSFSDLSRFPTVPLSSVTGITYVDIDGVEQTLSTSVYEVRTEKLSASIALAFEQSWPAIRSGSRITVEAVVGYDEVPAKVKLAILHLINERFENRGNGPTSANGTLADRLLANSRQYGF